MYKAGRCRTILKNKSVSKNQQILQMLPFSSKQLQLLWLGPLRTERRHNDDLFLPSGSLHDFECCSLASLVVYLYLLKSGFVLLTLQQARQ